MSFIGKKIFLALIASLLILIISPFNLASALSEDVKVPPAFQKDVQLHITSLYMKNPNKLTQKESKNLNHLLNLDRKQLLHALAETAAESKTTENIVIDFFSKYLMKNYILFLNETEPFDNADSPKRQAAYNVFKSITRSEHLLVLSKELETNKNFRVRHAILDLLKDKFGKNSIDAIMNIVPTERNQGVRSRALSIAFDLGDQYPDIIPIICKQYIKVGGTTAKIYYINSLRFIASEDRKTNWMKYLILNQEDPSAAKFWKDMQSESYDFRYYELFHRFENDQEVFKRLEEMNPKEAEIWKKANLGL